MSLRPPPADHAELADFPARQVADAYPYARIHAEGHDPEWFCASGARRFDPPRGSAEVFGTCYLAGHPLGAFVERFGDLGVVTRQRIDARCLAHLQVPATRLADLTDRRALGYGVTGELSSGGDYPGAQAWAERLFQAGFGGLWYTARHDPRGDLHSVALFAKPGLHPDAFAGGWSQPIGMAAQRALSRQPMSAYRAQRHTRTTGTPGSMWAMSSGSLVATA